MAVSYLYSWCGIGLRGIAGEGIGGSLRRGTRSTSAWGKAMRRSLRENMRWKGSTKNWIWNCGGLLDVVDVVRVWRCGKQAHVNERRTKR